MTMGERSRGVAWVLVGCALFIHARSYDFFADDGFIALRYSLNLLEHGELAYNPGERVEGFTSPLWVLLVALLGLLGGSLTGWAQALGIGSALATLYAVARLWKVYAPGYSPWGAVVVGALLAGSASFAAWSMGGLEAPLFALCLTAAFATLGEACKSASVRRWAICGVWCALASLARPEGMALVLPALVLAAIYAYRQRTWLLVSAFALPVVVLVGGYLFFRLQYYGYPLPNTYYVKTTGGRGLVRRGVRYVEAMANEYGLPTVVALAAAIVAPLVVVRQHIRRWLALDVRAVLHIGLSATSVAFIIYLTRVGGDFLDLYRFIAPILPLSFTIIVASAIGTQRWLIEHISASSATYARWLLGAAALALVFDYSRHQLWMGVRSTDADWFERPRNAPEKPNGVEPIHWTRMGALRWSALGRALQAAAAKGDTMATGAAGAAPYTSGLPNVDLFGLNDEWVARHGRVVGNRPGHQRSAGVPYITKRKPTFLFAAGPFYDRRAKKLRRNRVWSKRGYVAAEVRVDKQTYGAPEPFYQQLFVRKHRAKTLANRREWRFEKPREKRSSR